MAYSLIAFGMGVYAVALVQLPVMEIVNQFDSTYVTFGWLNLPYVLAAFLLFIGASKYMGIIKPHSKSFSPLIGSLCAIGVGALSMLLPHAPTGIFYPTLGAIHINTSLATIAATLLALATLEIALVKQSAGPVYTEGLAWTLLGLALLSLATFVTVYFQLNGFTGVVVRSGLFFVPFILGAVFSLKGAVGFSRIEQY